MKNTREEWWLSFLNGRGTYQETRFDEDAGKIVEFYQNRGYIKANVGAPEARVVGDSDDMKTRWIELRIPVTEGPALPGRHVRRVRQHRRDDRAAPAALQPQRRANSTAWTTSAKASRRRARRTAPAATSSSPASRTTSSATSPTPPNRRHRTALAVAAPSRAADRRRHDAARRRAAVLHQPHHVRRQYDDARQRHPPRDAAPRRRRVQHGSAEVQHQAAQSARLLQAARGRQGHHRRQDARRHQQGRRQGEAGGTEPQPDQLRRRRLRVRGLLRPGVVPDEQLPRPRREPHRVAVGRLPRAELHRGLHRAVPVRSQHDRQRQSVPERRAVHRTVHAALAGGRVRVRVSSRQLYAAVHQLQLRACSRHRNRRRHTTIRWFSRATPSWPIRC